MYVEQNNTNKSTASGAIYARAPFYQVNKLLITIPNNLFNGEIKAEKMALFTGWTLMTPFNGRMEAGGEWDWFVIKCSRSLQDIQFDTKQGYLSRLTPNNLSAGQGQDDPI